MNKKEKNINENERKDSEKKRQQKEKKTKRKENENDGETMTQQHERGRDDLVCKNLLHGPLIFENSLKISTCFKDSLKNPQEES